MNKKTVCLFLAPNEKYDYCVMLLLQRIINHLRLHSHSATYSTAMPAPLAQQIIGCFKSLMGKDGTYEGIHFQYYYYYYD